MEILIQQSAADQDGWNGVYEGDAGLTLDGRPVTYEELCQHGLGHMVAGPVISGPRGSAESDVRPPQQPQSAPDTSIFFS